MVNEKTQTKYVNFSRDQIARNKLIAYLVISIIVAGGLGLLGGYYWGKGSIPEESILLFNPIIDGIIEDNWELADYKIEKWFDINESESDNVDGINYMYIGRNSTHLLVAMDLISKQDDDDSGEWLGLWLSTTDENLGYNESDISTMFNVSDFLDRTDLGTECLIYDMENSTIYPFIKEDCSAITNSFDVLEEYVTITSGELRTDGWVNPNTWDMVYEQDNDECVISSEQKSINSDVKDHILINVSFNIADIFPSVPNQYLDQIIEQITDINITLDCFLVNQSYTNLLDWSYLEQDQIELGNFYIENNGTENNADISFSLFSADVFNVNSSAIENGYLNFSIEVYNSTFNPRIIDLWIDYLEIDMTYKNCFDGLYGASSIENATIEYDFSNSSNCELDHRTIEIAIPIDEIDINGTLKIFAQGGGITPNNYPSVSELRWDELWLSARNIQDSYSFTIGEDYYGAYNGGNWVTYWCPQTPIWSRNFIPLYESL